MSLASKIGELATRVGAELKALRANLGGMRLVKLTQAEYDALASKDANALYVIVG